MSRDFGTIATNKTEVLESPILMFPGVSSYWQLQIAGTGTLTVPTMSIYKEGNPSDLAGTLLSGSMSISGRVIQTKIIGSLVGGSKYKAYIMFKDGDIPTVRELTIICPKLGVNPSKYQFGQDKYRVDESPITIYPGQSVDSLSITIAGQGVIGASPTVYLYKDLNDVSATGLSGAAVVTNRLITLPTIQNLVGGSPYILYVLFTDDGKSTIRYLEINCPKLGV